MKSGRMVLGAVLSLISLPLLLVLADAVSFRVRNRSDGSLVSSGQKREYVLYVPRSYDRTRPTPLVISMHGAGGWPVQQMNVSGWNRLAERERFLVVYPSGTSDDGPRIWHVDGGHGLARDVRFISELIDTLEATNNIDATRIYANGLSNGGSMAFALSCTLSDRIAAVGMVAAAQLLPFSWCTDHRPVPMIAFHGTADPLAPYRGGTSWVARERFFNIPAFTASWARRNRCAPDPVETAVAPGVTRVEYPECAADAAVALYRIEGEGHSWPGGEPMPEWLIGRTSHRVDATSRMWVFFREHPLTRPAGRVLGVEHLDAPARTAQAHRE